MPEQQGDGKNRKDAPASGEENTTDDNKKCLFDSLVIRIEVERLKHKLAASHYGCRSLWFLFVPSILIAMAIGILSLLAEREDNLRYKNRFTLYAGCLALLSTFLQGLTKQLDLDGKKRVHKSTAIALKRLSEKIELERNFVSCPNGVPSTLTEWTKQFENAVETCDSEFPPRLANSFGLLFSRLDVALGPERHDARFATLYIMAFEHLVAGHYRHWRWPLFIANPNLVVVKTIEDMYATVRHEKSPNDRCCCFYRFLSSFRSKMYPTDKTSLRIVLEEVAGLDRADKRTDNEKAVQCNISTPREKECYASTKTCAV